MEFISPSGGNKCTPAQYLAEIVVSRKIMKKIGYIPEKFWNLPLWSKDYRQQIPTANKILNTYKVEHVLSALNTKECGWIHSLNCPDLIKAIELELKKSEVCDSQKTKIDVNIENTTMLPTIKKITKSKLDKLRGLDG